MKRLGVLLLFIFLISLSPTSADREDLYSAIKEIRLSEINHETPHTEYGISYEFEFWNAYEELDLTADTLGVEKGTCLFNLVVTTTNDLENISYCMVEARNPNNDGYRGSVFDPGIFEFPGYRTLFLRREGLHLNFTDYDGVNFPDGNITFSIQATDLVPKNVVGTSFDEAFITTNNKNTIVKDLLPENYGETGLSSQNYLHTRMKIDGPAWISQRNITETEFTFDITGQILNKGGSFTQSFPSTCTEGIYANVSFLEIDNNAIDRHSTFCGDSVTQKRYPGRKNVVYQRTIELYARDKLIDALPNGVMDVWIDSHLPSMNIFVAHIESIEGEISVWYDALPDWWNDFDISEYNPSDMSNLSIHLDFIIGSIIVIVVLKKRR